MTKDPIQDSLDVTKECVYRELCDANIYYSLMFKWINGLVGIKTFNREFEGLCHFLKDALETKYIFALAKVFARSKEAGLWRLIRQVKDVSKAFIEIKLERHAHIRDESTRNRKEFLSRFDEYEKKIKEISDKISPYRNIQRAHNIPWWNHDSEETWNQTKEWLSFAETVYVQAMDGICGGSCRIGEFYPSELNGQIKYFVQLIEKGLVDAKREKDELIRKTVEK
ncbi:MAG: hypothetical protein WC484_07660 [Candidatus Omnitrophota bacterium]